MGDNEQSSQGSVMTKQIQKQTGKNKPEQKDVNERQLRDREERFCQEIVLGKTHYEAYLNAGYKANNKVTASNLASRLLKNDRIQTRLAVLRAEAAERYKVTPDNIFMRTGAILNADMSNYMTWGPNGVTLKPSSELTPEQSAAVEEIRDCHQGWRHRQDQAALQDEGHRAGSQDPQNGQRQTGAVGGSDSENHLRRAKEETKWGLRSGSTFLSHIHSSSEPICLGGQLPHKGTDHHPPPEPHP
jgi:phage terminase small subunit